MTHEWAAFCQPFWAFCSLLILSTFIVCSFRSFALLYYNNTWIFVWMCLCVCVVNIQHKRRSLMHNANCGVMNNNNRNHFDSYFGRIFSLRPCIHTLGLWTNSFNVRGVCVFWMCIFLTLVCIRSHLYYMKRWLRWHFFFGYHLGLLKFSTPKIERLNRSPVIFQSYNCQVWCAKVTCTHNWD